MNRAQALAMVKAAPVAPIPFKAGDGFSNVIVLKRHVAKVPYSAFAKLIADRSHLSAGTFSEDVLDTYDLRRACPVRWMRFCQLQFPTAADVQSFFNTDEKTVRNWLLGKHAPASPFVVKAIACFPSALPILLGAA